MMTKEEVSGIVVYFEEKNISYKQRLDELSIPAWKFYDSKRKYAHEREVESAGETFLAIPLKLSCSRSGRQKDLEIGAISVSILLRTPTETMLRINDDLTGRELRDIIIWSSTYV